jgi:hypothetical protein
MQGEEARAAGAPSATRIEQQGKDLSAHRFFEDGFDQPPVVQSHA